MTRRGAASSPHSQVLAIRISLVADPTGGNAWLSLAQAALKAGKAAGARHLARRSAVLLPDTPAPLIACADAFHMERRLEEWAATVRKAVRLPMAEADRRRLAFLLLQEGAHAAAADALTINAVAHPRTYGATTDACLAASLRDLRDRADLFARASACLRPPTADASSARATTADTLRLSDRFFSALPEYKDADRLPVVEGAGPPLTSAPTILVAFDDRYARRFLPLHVGAAAQGTAAYRLHLVDPTPETLAWAEQTVGTAPTVQLSWERPGLDSASWRDRLVYYSCIRFIRALDLLREGRGDLLVSDADNILHPGALQILDGDYDLALAADDRRIPWYSYNVSLVHLRNRPATAAFLETVVRYIRHFMATGTAAWRLDQNAFFCAAGWHRRQTTSVRIDSLLERVDRVVARKIAHDGPPD